MPDIRIIGPIDEELYEEFVMRFDALEVSKNVNKRKPLVIEITSEGGSPYIALAIVARMRRSAFKITTVGSGLIASAATLILASGDRRLMTSESWLMVHEDHGEVTGNISTIEKDVVHMRAMEDQWNKLLANKTNISADEWESINAKGDTYMTAEDSLHKGLIDEII